MAVTVLLLILFSLLLAVLNYKNKYCILFALMSVSIALYAITLIIEIQRISTYSVARVYFFSELDTKLFFFLSKLFFFPVSTVMILRNVGVAVFLAANLAFVYLFERYRKHSSKTRKHLKRGILALCFLFLLLYFVFYHPTVGYRIFLSQFKKEFIHGPMVLLVSRALIVVLTAFTYLCPMVPVLYLVYYYRKGILTIFFEQLCGLVLILLAFDVIFFFFITESPFLKWNLLLRTGFWRGLSAELLPKYNLGFLPPVSFTLLVVIAFLLIRFQTINFIEYFKEQSIKKKLRVLHDNLRDVLHSEKNVIFNMKILAMSALEDYETEPGKEKEKLERLVHLCDSHFESLTQSINNIKDFKVNTIKRDFAEAIDGALDVYPLPEEIKVVKNYRCNEVFCNYDLYHMTQVIINLLENSVDSLKDREDKWIELSVDASDYWIQFSLKDNGNGIDPGVIKKIYKPYFSTKSKQRNWGIGLSYVQKVVKAHFGYMRIQSVPGEGTEVELLFMCV